MQRCGEEGGAGGGRGEIKIEARDASQSSAVHLSALTPQASKTSGAPNCSLPLARVLKTNLLVPKKSCFKGFTSEFCFPLFSLPQPLFVILRLLGFFYQQTQNAIRCIADKAHYFSCQKCCPIFGLTSSLLHPAPSQPVTLSKPTAFLGHYPSRGSAVLWLDTPTLFSQITTHNLA